MKKFFFQRNRTVLWDQNSGVVIGIFKYAIILVYKLPPQSVMLGFGFGLAFNQSLLALALQPAALAIQGFGLGLGLAVPDLGLGLYLVM